MAKQEHQLLTTTQLQHRLDVTTMTVHLWRKGTAERPAIPFIRKKRGTKFAIFFPLELVENWLALYKAGRSELIREDHCDCKHCTKRRATAKAPTTNTARPVAEPSIV